MPGTIIRTGPYAGLPRRQPTDRTTAIALPQARNLINAASFARRQGWPLNTSITITWPKTPLFTGANWAALQGRVFDFLGRYLKRRGIPVAFVWTRERARGMGPHTHCLLHLGPNPTAITFRLKAYLDRKFSFATRGVWIDAADTGLGSGMQAGALRYALKGVDHAAFRYVGLERENIAGALGLRDRGPQGIIKIKRAGCSRTIDAATRRRAGWREWRSLDDLRSALDPKFRHERVQGLIRINGRGRGEPAGARERVPGGSGPSPARTVLALDPQMRSSPG